MNENPGGTPNPLNPNPGVVTGAGPVPPIAPPTQPIQPEPTQPEPVQPQPEPVSVTPVTSEMPVTPELAAQPQPEPAKKSKKTGLIALIVLLIAVLIGGAVAAIMIFKPFDNRGDAVPMAIQKLFEDGRPTNVSMTGVITMTSSSATSPVSSLEIDFNSGINTVSTENYANATVTAILADDSEFSFDVDEIHTAGGDLYLKLSNVADALDNYEAQDSDQTNCIGDESGMTNCGVDIEEIICDEDDELCEEIEIINPSSSILDFISVFEVIDGEWIRIQGSEFSNVTDLMSLGGSAQCLIDAADGLGNYSDNFATLYKNNPFITYSTENLKIAQKKNQLYMLSFDADKLTNFLNSMTTAGFINDLIACTGGNATATINADEVKALVSEIPAIYVEIDDDYNFTRVYLELNSEDSSTTVTADLSLAYPTNITVNEPDEYIDINEVLSRILTMFYGQSVISY